MKKILVSGGGTAGHIYPLLEIVDFLKKRHELAALYVGGKGNLEEDLVSKKMAFKAISVGKLRRHLTLLHIRDSSRFVRGFLMARTIIKKFKPDLIFTKGGYVSLPVIIAAHQLKIPIIIHESDIVMGLANKLGSRFADKICVGYPINNYPTSLEDKLIYTGNPIRKEFFKKETAADRKLFSIKRDFPVILITAGSQGALAINQSFKPILKALLRKSQIIHLTGKNSQQTFIDIKEKLPPNIKHNYHPFGYLNSGMDSAVKVADLVISRAGSTISELTACGKPMILIPLPTSANNHQTKNAEFFAKEGAAISLSQTYLTPERLLKTINTILSDEHRKESMSKRSKKLARPDAVDKIVRVIEEELYHKIKK
jgi:UDP-N-acetylglucosamine--N-acetylmuramyl-(pentapeptide) pyrophosphoryl-undecaprenol N-acetylglucosamine transferase